MSEVKNENPKPEKPKVDVKIILEIQADKEKQLATHQTVNK